MRLLNVCRSIALLLVVLLSLIMGVGTAVAASSTPSTVTQVHNYDRPVHVVETASKEGARLAPTAWLLSVGAAIGNADVPTSHSYDSIVQLSATGTAVSPVFPLTDSPSMQLSGIVG